ncbi:MAG TPA: hypothetical protein VGH96_16150 [Streptosporangiaceae bacterium]
MELAAGAAQSTSAWAQPGTLGFLVVFGMGVVLYFVFRSMSRHLRKINQAARAEAVQAESVQAGAVQADAVQADAVQADAGQPPSGRGSLGRGSLGQGLPPAR